MTTLLALLTALALDEPTSMPSLIRAIADREKAIRNGSFTVSFETKRREPRTNKMASDTTSATAIFDNAGQVYFHSVKRFQFRHDDGKTTIEAKDEISSYRTGEAVVVEFARSSTPLARKGSSRRVLALEFDPYEVIMGFYSTPVSQHLHSDGASIKNEASKWVCICKEYIDQYDKKVKRRFSFDIDPNHGFIVTKRAVELSKSDGPWMTSSSIEWLDLVEIHPSIWMPMTVAFEMRNLDNNVEISWHACLDNWKINLDLPSSTFTAAIPNGTVVKDEVSGAVYRMAQVDDAQLAKQTEEAKKLAETVSEPTPISPPWWASRVAIWIAVMIAVGATLYWVICRLSR